MNLTEWVGKLRGSKTAEANGFMVFKDLTGQDRWTAWYSNNYEDRDAEFFSEKGIDAYISRLDRGFVPMPELWSWHEPGTRYGVADWVDRIGHFAVATGTYDDTDAGRAGKAYDQKHAHELGVSHGFVFKSSGIRYENGKRVFDDFDTFEISPLPKDKAANLLTAFAVDAKTVLKEKAMKPEKREHLVKKFGEAYVLELEKKTAKLGKAMEGLAVYKALALAEGEDEGIAALVAVCVRLNLTPGELAALLSAALDQGAEDAEPTEDDAPDDGEAASAPDDEELLAEAQTKAGYVRDNFWNTVVMPRATKEVKTVRDPFWRHEVRQKARTKRLTITRGDQFFGRQVKQVDVLDTGAAIDAMQAELQAKLKWSQAHIDALFTRYSEQEVYELLKTLLEATGGRVELSAEVVS